jgi:FKBP-type peptidyl-prolyl cis-trans isomerase FkpA
MRIIAVGLLALFVAGCSGTKLSEAKLETDDQKTLYALGFAVSESLKPFALTEAEMVAVHAGLADGVLKEKPKVEMEKYGPMIQQLAEARMAKAAEAGKAAGAELLAKAEKEAGAIKTESGVVVQTLTEGSGPNPKASDTVKVHYQGTLTDGTEFDSSIKRGQPVTFPLGNVIKCWIEGVQKMKVGGKSKLICPPETAYGDRGSPPVIAPGSTLIFEVELLEIVK